MMEQCKFIINIIQMRQRNKINVRCLREQGIVTHRNDVSTQEVEATSHKFQTKLGYTAIFWGGVGGEVKKLGWTVALQRERKKEQTLNSSLNTDAIW